MLDEMLTLEASAVWSGVSHFENVTVDVPYKGADINTALVFANATFQEFINYSLNTNK